MKKIKTQRYFDEIEELVESEVYAETLGNLMKAVYEVGYREGCKRANTEKELEAIYRAITDIMDSEVQLIADKEDKEFIERKLTDYLVTITNANIERKENWDETYLKNISEEYTIITRYIKLINLVLEGGSRK